MADRGVDVRAHIATSQQVRAMLWSSATAYVLAQLVVVLLHESSHSVAGLLLGYDVTQFTGEVRYSPAESDHARAVTAATGPLFSLVTGLVAITVRPFRRGFPAVLWAWLAFLSAEEGFGYLTIAPLVTAGDSGTVLDALAAPAWVGWVCSAVGIAGLFFLARRFAVVAVRWTRDLYEIRSFCVWAWLVGTAVCAVADIVYLALTPGTSGEDTVAILLGSVSLGIFAPMAMIFWQKVSVEKEPLSLPTVPVAAALVTVVLLVVKGLVFTRGLHLG